ncbi:MAG: nicotinate-nucleotide--dimethylbenzimidazole phosphoribosyltransferase [Planctomyces sp.]|nr:nicotinate-nucleotide--dimethylbenzimidazole phosphoribosyltransferase [Planctomyces sp.]
MNTIASHLDSLAKPPGSLGQLERLAGELCRIQGTLQPRSTPRRMVLFAGDHGVVAERVTTWPSAITEIMLQTIAAGKAACNALAQSSATPLALFDVGSLEGGQRNENHPLINRSHWIRAGTRNLAVEAALTRDEFRRAVEVGRLIASEAVIEGVEIFAGGEMGIGNTTPAACLTALICGAKTDSVVGRGAGASDEILNRKRQVVDQAVSRVEPLFACDPEEALAAVSGLEIAAIAGFYAEASKRGKVVVLDGFITTAAALIAETLWPGSRKNFIAAHRSVEPGHAIALDHLGLTPFLEWNLRLGEGTGALLLMPLLDAAAMMVTRMATLADLQSLVPRQLDPHQDSHPG